jgi:hypothetical protein
VTAAASNNGAPVAAAPAAAVEFVSAAVPAKAAARSETTPTSVAGVGSSLLPWLATDGNGDAPALAPLAWTTLAASRRELGTGAKAAGAAPNAAASGNIVGIFFGNGTAASPNGGIIVGNGYSWTADTCNQGTACTGGSGGIFGSGGSGYNGGNGGSAGWFGKGGSGGAALTAGGTGGNGGAGGLLLGSGGDGGTGGSNGGWWPPWSNRSWSKWANSIS